MKKILTLTAAVAVLAAASVASAQEQNAKALEGMYGMPGTGGTMMMMGSGNRSMGAVVMGENGMAPANCPEGGYYMKERNIIAPCGGTTTYRMRAVRSGEMMSSGEAYPEGAMVMDNGM